MLNVIAERPELGQTLRSDRIQVESVIDETLGYESPAQRLLRTTTRDVEVSGTRMPDGDHVTIFYGSANRDPSECFDPDEFRLDRNLRNQVAFGTGLHYCLGAPLARAEATVTLNALLDRISAIRRGRGHAIRQTFSRMLFGFEKLPLVFERHESRRRIHRSKFELLLPSEPSSVYLSTFSTSEILCNSFFRNFELLSERQENSFC